MAASKREKELARQRAERQAARRAAAATRRRQRTAVFASVVAVVVVAVGVVLVVSTLSGGASTDKPVAAAATPSASAVATPSASTAAGGCSYADAGAASREVGKPPTTGVGTSGTYDATVTMNVGTVVFRMDAAKTPCTVNSLRSLAHFSFFDGTPCHRLTSQGIFVLQCGDPSGTGTGGPGYRFADEALDGATYPRGTVAMANSGKDTNGSQFFLVYKDSELPADYTPVGKITDGLEVLDKVAEAGAEPPDAQQNTAPKLKTTILTLRTEPVRE